MKIVGCDFHPSYQQVAILDTETGEVQEQKLIHASGEAEEGSRGAKVSKLMATELLLATLRVPTPLTAPFGSSTG